MGQAKKTKTKQDELVRRRKKGLTQLAKSKKKAEQKIQNTISKAAAAASKPKAKERVSVLKHKVKQAKFNEAYAKKVQIVHTAQEMSWKVKLGSHEAKAAHSTVHQIAQGAPTVQQLAHERIQKAKKRLRKQHLEKQAHSKKIGRKKSQKQDPQSGAAVQVLL